MINQFEPIFDYADLSTDIVNYFKNEGWITEFDKTREFEKQIGNLLNTPFCSVVSNGTISLSLALLALGVKPHDEVLVPSLTMMATATAVEFIGARPVFVDIEARTLCMDLNDASSKVTPKTKAVVYVSLNGRCGNIEQVISFCSGHSLSYIEDAAQSFMSKYEDGSYIGSKAELASFSFSMPKIITTGQGGCLITQRKELFEKIVTLRDFGRKKNGSDTHISFGINAKFTDLQAIVGINQLKTINERVELKKQIYCQYAEELNGIVDFIPTKLEITTPWFVDIYSDQKQELATFLNNIGIKTRPVYLPLHKQPYYDVGSILPISEYMSKRGLWLPSSLNLNKEQIICICNAIKEFFGKEKY